jgi:Reverse transcriptase (RNA-dependent DNA polymerase)
VKTAFLNGPLDEEIYMEAPPGYDFNGKVLKLKKALYGLKQAARAWNQELIRVLKEHRFEVSIADASLFKLVRDGRCSFLLIYVDDGTAVGTKSDANEIIRILEAAFDIRRLGTAAFFLGMEIVRDRQARTILLSQKKYTQVILSRTGMTESKPRSIPMEINIQLSKDGDDLMEKPGEYAEVLGMLLYLATCTRPDLAHAVGLLARFMAKPRQEHWIHLKGVLRYLCKTRNRGIMYGGKDCKVEGYCDSNYAADPDKRRSTGGFVFLLAGGAISWGSKLLPTVATSTLEAEYMASACSAKEALWIRKLMTTLRGVEGAACITINCDNQGALALQRNPTSHQRAKHIDVSHHFVRERVARGEIEMQYCPTEDMLADLFTKALAKPKHEKFCEGIGLVDIK